MQVSCSPELTGSVGHEAVGTVEALHGGTGRLGKGHDGMRDGSGLLGASAQAAFPEELPQKSPPADECPHRL